jgi:alkylhydroperoxidase family enzyme
MRMTTPRVAPLKEQELTPEMLDLLGPRFRGIPLLNIFRTLARAPKAYKRFMVWGGYILSDANALSPRDRELVILRTGFNWQSGLRMGPACSHWAGLWFDGGGNNAHQGRAGS